MNLKKIVLICLSWFLVCLSLYSYFLYKDRALVKNEKVSSKELAESTEEDTTPVDTEVTSLKNEYNNSDIKGVISIEGEDEFHYPIAQSNDNEFYLSHDYHKNYYKHGSIFADYRIDLDSSDKVLLFGHNSSFIKTPFGNLENYYDVNYYNNHKYIDLKTENSLYRYEIFSVYVETSDFTYVNLNFDSKKGWYEHLEKLKSKSLYDTKVEVSSEDKILIMQTCSNNPNYKAYAKKYLLVIAKLVH